MADKPTVVILGGTAEARNLAARLTDNFADRVRVITSLAGRTASPRQLRGEVRLGGFGGVEGLSAYLRDVGAHVLVDATHPYAAQISAHAAHAATGTNIHRLLLRRPPWEKAEGDNWIHAQNISDAVEIMSKQSRRCLITTGAKELEPYVDIRGTDLIVRLIEPPSQPIPIAKAEVVIGRPPYRLDEEIALFKMLGIDTIVSKNAGGNSTKAKIDAARSLGIAVVMIDRPASPEGDSVTTMVEAEDRIRVILGF